MGAPPLVEQLGNVAVEALVGMARRLGDEAFGLALRKRSCDLLSVRSSLVPVEQQATASVRMQLPSDVEDGGSRRCSVGEDQRYVASLCGEPTKLVGCLLPRRAGGDGVGLRVALGKL